jgi:hypothetical protein
MIVEFWFLNVIIIIFKYDYQLLDPYLGQSYQFTTHCSNDTWGVGGGGGGGLKNCP